MIIFWKLFIGILYKRANKQGLWPTHKARVGSVFEFVREHTQQGWLPPRPAPIKMVWMIGRGWRYGVHGDGM